MLSLNSTGLTLNVTDGRESYAVEIIKLINALPLFWLKVIPNIAFIIGMCANILLAIYLIKYRRYRSPIFTLILSMCLVDGIMCAISFVWTAFRYPYLTGPAWLCQFTQEVLFASIINSSYHLTVMSLVRFYQLVFPLSARVRVTSGLMVKICIGVWIFSYSTSIPFAIAIAAGPWYEYEGDVYRWCIGVGTTVKWGNMYNTIVNLFVPFTITAVFHIAKHCIVLKAGSMSASSEAEQKRETTDTRAVMIVITTYLVTAAPIAVELILLIIGVPIGVLANIIITNVQFLNSVFNPFIYAFAAQSVRRDVIRMLKCL